MANLKQGENRELWIIRSDKDENPGKKVMVRVDRGEWRELTKGNPVIMRGSDLWGEVEIDVVGEGDTTEWEIPMPEGHRVKLWVMVVYRESERRLVIRKDYSHGDGIEVERLLPILVEK